MTDKIILNNGTVPEKLPELGIAAHLRSYMNRLKGEFYDIQRGRVDYSLMRNSELYREYVADTALLRNFDLALLESQGERLAFWINIYNTLVIHGVIELEIRESVKEVSGFFHRFGYQIGDMVFSPDDVEHGILRGNQRPPYGIFHPFSPSDPRLAHVLEKSDPRIHFALVCASSSCPPINFYTPQRIDEQLDVAASGFINSPEVEVLPEKNLILLSPVFKWYHSDFGGSEGIIDTLINYMDSGDKKDFLLERGMGADIEWKEYDWSLNG